MDEIGRKIIFSGFGEVDDVTLPVVNKLVNAHASRINDLAKNLESIHITLKPIHQREKSEKYEIHAKAIDNGKVYLSKVTERNLLAALDKALNKVIHEMD